MCARADSAIFRDPYLLGFKDSAVEIFIQAVQENARDPSLVSWKSESYVHRSWCVGGVSLWKTLPHSSLDSGRLKAKRSQSLPIIL